MGPTWDLPAEERDARRAHSPRARANPGPHSVRPTRPRQEPLHRAEHSGRARSLATCSASLWLPGFGSALRGCSREVTTPCCCHLTIDPPNSGLETPSRSRLSAGTPARVGSNQSRIPDRSRWLGGQTEPPLDNREPRRQPEPRGPAVPHREDRALGHAASRTRPPRVGPYVRGLSRDCGAQTHRSEEHTSELQSRSDLVCRLLLEKKKQTGGRPQKKLKQKITR